MQLMSEFVEIISIELNNWLELISLLKDRGCEHIVTFRLKYHKRHFSNTKN